MEPKWKGGQLEICNAVLDKLSSGLPNDKEKDERQSSALHLVHRFLVYAFTTPFSDKGPVDSIIEQTILLASFSRTNGWQTGSAIINEQLKAWQYISRTTFIHCAFLNDLSAPYTPPTTDETTQNLSCHRSIDSNSDNESDSESEDDLENTPLCGLLDFSALDILATGPKDASEPRSGEGQLLLQYVQIPSISETFFECMAHGSKFRFFQNNSKVFNSKTLSHQWGRCSALWSVLLSHSKTEGSATIVDWAPDGRTLALKASYCTIDINIDTFQSLIVNLPKDIWQCFLELFPKGFPQSYFDSLEALSISAFHDDPNSPNSLLDREDNINVLLPYRELLESMLHDNVSWSHYDDALSNFQNALVYGIMTCNGVPMRSFQTASLQFSPSMGFPRNLYINGDQSYIGKPRAKQRHSGLIHYEAYWGLHNKVGLAAILYCGIFRHLEPSLLLGRLPETADTSKAANGDLPFFFIKVISPRGKKEFIGWDGHDINHALRKEDSPLRAEGRVHRHFMKAFLRKYMSTEAIQISQKYSVPGRQPPLPNMQQERRDSGLNRDMQLEFSMAVHRLLGLDALDESQALEAVDTVYRDHALALARHLVKATYSLSGDAVLDIQEKVQQLVLSLPFMYGSDRVTDSNAEWRSLGDTVLVEVTAIVIYGPTRPSALESMPFEGYHISFVAAALNMVSTTCHFDTP